MPATREAWHQLTNSEEIRQLTAQCATVYQMGNARSYDASKRGLPMVCYMCTFDETTGTEAKPKPLGHWRLQRAARLNGLIMHDFDHLSKKGITPRQLWESLPPHWFDSKSCPTAVLLGHVTPSGDGLRLVTVANPDLDIEQNQQAVLTQIKAIDPARFAALEADGSCINADRGSFLVGAGNILYINDEIFDYDNPKYDEKFGQKYRTGHVSGSNRSRADRPVALPPDGAEPVQQQSQNVQQPAAQDGAGGQRPALDGGVGTVVSYPDTYHGVEYARILDTWFEQNGGEPAQGDRHKTMLRLIADLRYICDNNKGFISSVIMQREFIRNWVANEGAAAELESMLASSCERELWWGTPKRLKAVLDAVGVSLSPLRPNTLSEEQEQAVFENFWNRLKPLLSEPYTPACEIVSDANKLAALMAAGTMYCTLMTRTWFEHYDGKHTRLNPTTMIIGKPASGKSFAADLNSAIMAAMRNADAPGRKAEKEYKRKRKERENSKASKDAPLQQPEEMIRMLPSKTSNAVFFRRAENAHEVIDGELTPLHLYMFDSELDSSVTAQSGGTWIGKHDLELKAFHNEFSGVDYGNNDSVNDLIPIFWNQVITGTYVSLQKKINMRNINDGLCTRICIVKMYPDRFKMMKRGSATINHETEVRLKEWGYRFDGMKGELKVRRLVDHCYDLCEQYAEMAEERQDDVLDLLRKRAVFYAIWFTIPRIYGRQWEHYRETGEVEVNDDDLQFASIIYEAVVYWQDYFFGRMLSDSWQNADNEIQPRANHHQKSSADFAAMPQQFTIEDVARLCALDADAARKRANRWLKAGYVRKLANAKPAVYEKVVNEIVM